MNFFFHKTPWKLIFFSFFLSLLTFFRAGKPPTGLHLDVMKDDKLIQKLMVDEKKCYLFGRHAQLNDFVTDHASCSRVHASFVYHKFLNIAYLVDLGSSKFELFNQVLREYKVLFQLTERTSGQFAWNHTSQLRCTLAQLFTLAPQHVTTSCEKDQQGRAV